MKTVLAVLKTPVALPAEPPEWWQLLPYGEVYISGEEKPLIMDDETASDVLRYFAELGRDMVVDYEHQTLKDMQAPAAGWIKELQWRCKEGLWARTEWTERAAGYITAKEYRYFSPVMFHRKRDRRIVAVYNVALTNEPRTRNIQAIAAKLDFIQTYQPKESDMFKKLIQILKLADDADQAAVEAAVEKLVAKNTELQAKAAAGENLVACKGVLEALELDDSADEAAVIARISGLSATGTAAADLSAQVAKLTAKIADMESGDLVAQALKNGQTSPDELEKWGRALAKDNPEQFKVIVLSRPVGSVVPVGKVNLADDPSGKTQVDDAVLTVAKLMGNDPEDVKKYAG